MTNHQRPKARPAVEADLPAVLALYRQLSPNRPVAEGAPAASIWQEMLERPGITVFVAPAHGEPAATCTLIVIPNLTAGGRSYAVVENVVTQQDQRRSGLGRAVLEAALDAAWAAGCYKAMLLSGRPEDSGVPEFYERIGFRRGIKTGFQASPPDRSGPGMPHLA